jgi:hypothetical protein
MSKYREWVGLFAILALMVCTPRADVQQLTKLPRVGYLFGLSPSVSIDRVEAFRQALSELGYAEGKNIVIEYRWADGKIERLPGLMAELARLNVDVIVTAGPSPTRSAKEATATIPIVMAWDYDPVGNGFVASLARPGGNITGSSTLATEISGKQLEQSSGPADPRPPRAQLYHHPRRQKARRAFARGRESQILQDAPLRFARRSAFRQTISLSEMFTWKVCCFSC